MVIDEDAATAFDQWLKALRNFDPRDVNETSDSLCAYAPIDVAALFSTREQAVLDALKSALEVASVNHPPPERPLVDLWIYEHVANTAAFVQALDTAAVVCRKHPAAKPEQRAPDDAAHVQPWFRLRVLLASLEVRRGNFQTALDLLDATTGSTAAERLTICNGRIAALLGFGSIRRATEALAAARAIQPEDSMDEAAQLAWADAANARLLNHGRLLLAQDRAKSLRQFIDGQSALDDTVRAELEAMDVRGAIKNSYSDPMSQEALIQRANRLFYRLPIDQHPQLWVTIFELQTALGEEDNAEGTAGLLQEWLQRSPNAYASQVEELFLAVQARRLVGKSAEPEFQQEAGALLQRMQSCLDGVLEKWRGADANDTSAGFVTYRAHRMLLGSMIRLAVALDEDHAGTKALRWLFEIQRSSGAVRNLVARGLNRELQGPGDLQSALGLIPNAGLVCFFSSTIDSWALVVTKDDATLRQLPPWTAICPEFQRLTGELASATPQTADQTMDRIAGTVKKLSRRVLDPLGEDLATLRNLATIDVGLLHGFPAAGLHWGDQTLGEALGVWTPPPLPCWELRATGKAEETPARVGVADLSGAIGANGSTTDDTIASLKGEGHDVSRLDAAAAIGSWLSSGPSTGPSTDAVVIAHGEYDITRGSAAIQLAGSQFDGESAFGLPPGATLPKTLVLGVCQAGSQYHAVGEPGGTASLGGALVSAGVAQVVQSRSPLRLETATYIARVWASTWNGERTPAERLSALRRALIQDRGWSPLRAALLEMHGRNSGR